MPRTVALEFSISDDNSFEVLHYAITVYSVVPRQKFESAIRYVTEYLLFNGAMFNGCA